MHVHIYEQQQKVLPQQCDWSNYLTREQDAKIWTPVSMALYILYMYPLPCLHIIYLSLWSLSTNIVLFLLTNFILIFTVELSLFVLHHLASKWKAFLFTYPWIQTPVFAFHKYRRFCNVQNISILPLMLFVLHAVHQVRSAILTVSQVTRCRNKKCSKTEKWIAP
jgi:hypothetical protein